MKNEYLVGDSFQVLKSLPDKYATIITSPRYNINMGYIGVNDCTENYIYLKEMERMGELLLDVATDDCVFFLNVGDNSKNVFRSYEVVHAYTKAGWKLVQTIVWLKSFDGNGHFTPVSGNKLLHNMYENIFILVKNRRKYSLDRLSIGVPYKDKSNISRYNHKSDVRCAGNVWYIPYETITTKRPHPAVFPFELPTRCIKLNGCKGPVLDPFAGLGTVGNAAKALGVSSTCIDIHDYR